MATKSPKPSAASTNPCIEITPTPEQYERLCLDLKELRKRGATSNTDAILTAVRDAAAQRKMAGDKSKGPGGAQTPPARQQEV